jgi:Dolichyl-phosphate-mannose-protein mannosyltransferase
VAGGRSRDAHRRDLLLIATGLFALGVRVIGIGQPFVDEWSWRQADVATIAENFYRHRFNLFYPQINWAGSAPGYVGTEFPLVPFLAAALYLVFGVQDWIGRAISLAFFAGSLPFFHLLVRRVATDRAALCGVAIYAVAPLGVFASRAFMPDIASLSLSIAAVSVFAGAMARPHRPRLLIASGVLMSFAILVKAPAIVIGVPLLALAWERYGGRLVFRRDLWLCAALALVVPAAWYSHAYLISVSHYPYHFFGEPGIGVVSADRYLSIARATARQGLTLPVTVLMLAGTVLAWRTRARVFVWWLLAVVVFTVAVGEGSTTHPWYQLPLVPIAAALGGLAADRAWIALSRRAGPRLASAVVGVCAVAVALIAYVQVRPWYEPWAEPLRAAGREIGRISPPGALVIVADGGDPTALYYSGRRGWHALHGRVWGAPADGDEQKAIRQLEALRAEGAGYLAFTRYTAWWLDRYPLLRRHLETRYRRVRDTTDYVIFDLTTGGPEDDRAEGRPHAGRWPRTTRRGGPPGPT